ncbi:glucuronate isomerase [Flammeovirga yaeyamensis]|uniref:Uronate isomerase n=1 Tax=Flammeovirga yaeyamensis TaxID=367791 RepID=A0AAX1N5U8_9BACT|nr:glucuronate isomerase [Flammeovirga yaeyamensis]MBB3700772.1 glucuronate isomerase [Flammeovirga yaeyamensis]NMF37872.1 glucuronate isomerase [Flammeovirga yaeyamensis]QWG01766.1 glucuronate isomerase [Flammeovirga yaeyamensis]
MFIHEDFLLENENASRLYHEFASNQPIIDFHCHLSPKDIADNRKFNNLTEAWLEGDHYKWRAMRTAGIEEKYITGNESANDKFIKWAETVPQTLRNPLFHWTHLELKRYFDIDTFLDQNSAQDIYQSTSETLSNNPEFSTRNLMKKMGVKIVCTTDDPIDSLTYHRINNLSNSDTKIFPTWRPDRAIYIEKGKDFVDYIYRLGKSAEININSFDALKEALSKRMDHFELHGCVISDHGFKSLPLGKVNDILADKVLKRALNGNTISDTDLANYQSTLIDFLGKEYSKRDWVMQLHLGVIRNNSKRQFNILGADTGFDSMSDAPQADAIVQFFSHLDENDELPKTIVYNLNPADNYMVGTMIGNFQDGSIAGKIQMGSGWWFLDQKEGMEMQLNALSNLGLLSKFVGMLTDSRSFLSFPRHEYFRRTLCNLLGKEMDLGILPNDINWIGKMVQDICYNNIKSYAFKNEKATIISQLV